MTSTLFGQINLTKGIYYGRKVPFMYCYLNIKDSSYTFEQFSSKSSPVFQYIPTRKLTPIIDPIKKNLILNYKGDSIEVYKSKETLTVKLKGQAPIKMQLTNLSDTVITININKNTDFNCYQLLIRELRNKPNFNDSLFNQLYSSFKLENYYKTNIIEFKKKCVDLEVVARNKWN